MIQQTENLDVRNAFGEFSLDGSEYRIHNVRTPRPWCNVFSNGAYGLVLSHTGGGFSWIENSQLQRLTRFDQDLTCELHGRFVYVADRSALDSPWSTTFLPTHREAEKETVTQGIGYTKFERVVDGIRTEQTVFVPVDRNCEYWILEVENQRTEVAELRLATYLEWHLGSQGDWHREFHRLFMETECHKTTQVAWKHTGLRENSRLTEKLPFVAYHAVTGAEEVRWFSDKTCFLGSPGHLAIPAGLADGAEVLNTGRWDDPIASAMFDLTLQPGEKRTILMSVGVERDKVDALARANGQSLEVAIELLEATKRHWAAITEATEVQTPDPIFDLLNNKWFKYQTICGRMDARSAYYQQGGAYGYRDQLQDSLLCLMHQPERTLKQLSIQSEAMYEDGGVRHWWHPGTNIFAESHHNDTCLWLAHGTLAYLDETNDLLALENRYRFLNRSTQAFGETGSLLDHVLRGVDRALNRISPRGLPLLGAGDWNDGLSHAGLEGKGESVWLGMFLYDILRRWRPILEELGDTGRAQQFAQAESDLASAIETHGWDGEWYIAGTRDDGGQFGSHENEFGSLFLNPQTWAVISELAAPERAAKAMEVVKSRLIKPYGALLLAPAYASVDPYIGYITRYAPGLRENGGVYSHASTWAVIALAQLGQVDQAYDLFRAMCPAKASDQAARYSAEPYVMPGNIDGPDSPKEGRAGWTWYTGSSAWMNRVALEWICGVRSTRTGLIFGDAPSTWDRYSVRRRYRGQTYEVKSEGIGAVREIRLNGESVSGPLLAKEERPVQVVELLRG